MDNNKILKTLVRIKSTDDGQEFIEFLKVCSANNYKAWKATKDGGDLFKGQAIALDDLVEIFDTAESKLTQSSYEAQPQEWL